MRSLRSFRAPFSFLILACIIGVLTGCGGGSSKSTPAALAVSTTSMPDGTVGTPYSSDIQATGGTAPYTWSVSSGTLPDHLALDSSTTSSVSVSGTPETAQSNVQFTVQVTDSASQSATKVFAVSVAASSIKVAITNKLAGILPAAAGVVFNASVQNDSATQGVNWTLTANNADCSPACGSLSGASATSVTYTPPATIPTAPNNTPKLTATAVADASKSDSNIIAITNSPLSACTNSGNEAVLNGQYAFLLQGYDATNAQGMAGSFTADGTGHITAGHVDSNGSAVHSGAVDTTNSSYSVGADNRGCLTVVTPSGTTVMHFAVGGVSANVATKGSVVRFDDSLGTGVRASGKLMKQDATSFSGNLSGNYALKLMGEDSTVGRFGAEGAITASGTLLSNGEIDTNDAGTTAHVTGATGLLGSSVDANGRGTATVSTTTAFPGNLVFYMVSASEALVVSSDVLSINTPAVSGELRLQSGSLTNASLNGISVFHKAGIDTSGRIAAVGTQTADGSGAINLAIYEDDAGTAQPVQNVSATYAVASNGRVTLTGAGTGAPVFYLTGTNAGFMLGTDATVTDGEFKAQAAGPFSNSTLSGDYFFATNAVGSQAADSVVGEVTTDGAGNASLQVDASSSTGLSIDQSQSSAFTVGSNGIGTLDGDAFVVVSADEAVAIQGGTGNTNPNIIVIEK